MIRAYQISVIKFTNSSQATIYDQANNIYQNNKWHFKLKVFDPKNVVYKSVKIRFSSQHLNEI